MNRIGRRLRPARRRVAALGALAVFGIVVIAGGAVALAGSSGDADVGPARVQARTGAVDARLAESFGVFRANDLQVDGDQATAGPSPFGQNPQLSRAVPISRGGAVYLIPGNDAVCLGDGVNYGHTCASVEDATAGKLFLVTLGDPRSPYTTVSGLAPDGVSQADVDLASGKSVTVPVHNNVYDAEIAGTQAVTGISWSSKSGQRFSQEFGDGGLQRPRQPVDQTGD